MGWENITYLPRKVEVELKSDTKGTTRVYETAEFYDTYVLFTLEGKRIRIPWSNINIVTTETLPLPEPVEGPPGL